VDVPTVRRHKLSNTSVTAQSYVLVRVRLANGAEGIGEAATLGGPRWSEESVEAMKANIDAYLAPALLGSRADRFEAAGLRMDQAAKRNNAAKAAIETALFDAVGKTLGLPAAALLGGAVRDRIPVLWTLASGDPAQEAEEAGRKLDARLHRTFKVKIGAQDPAADMARMRHLARALEGRATLIVDANQAWDETVSARCLPQLHEMGVALVEQPVPAWNIVGLARLRARPGTPPLLADECVFDAHDMLAVAHAAASSAVSATMGATRNSTFTVEGSRPCARRRARTSSRYARIASTPLTLATMVSACRAANCRPRGEPPACAITGRPCTQGPEFSGPRDAYQRPLKSTWRTFAWSASIPPSVSATRAPGSHESQSWPTRSMYSSAMS